MKLRRLVLALCVGSSILSGCTLDDGTGNPDPGLYWKWECPEGGTPLDASAPIDYLASGSCGTGGPFTLSVDGCEMLCTRSALGLSNVVTVTYTSSPGAGGWSVAGTGGLADAGASWSCTANAAAGADLMFVCSNATTTTCRSTLAPVNASPEAGAD
jgi:hypothetical protein